jgi:NAD(P)-dependent dehydrogenase (short-subunit alcohol dehydrogenase family)
MLTQEPVNGSRGRVVNIASIGGLVGLAAEPAYCAAKGAVVNLTRQLAVDFAPERITSTRSARASWPPPWSARSSTTRS